MAARAIRAAARWSARAAHWPAPVRDACAAVLALLSVGVGKALILALPVPAEAVLALPGLLVAGLLLGWPSMAFGALVSTLAVVWMARTRPVGLLGASAEEAAALLALAAGLAGACVGARIWSRRRERRASRLMDACAEDALWRIDEAEARLAKAEAEAAAARAQLARRQRLVAQTPDRDADLDAARRAEGGI